jgi:hypothetical protein
MGELIALGLIVWCGHTLFAIGRRIGSRKAYGVGFRRGQRRKN